MIKNFCLLGSDEIFRVGLAHILQDEGFEIAGTFGKLCQIEEAALPSEFLAIVDLPGDEKQAEAVMAFKALHPSSHVVVLSGEFDLDAMAECFSVGADGYILRSLKLPELIQALRLIAQDAKLSPSKLTETLPSGSRGSLSAAEMHDTMTTADLSPRQYDVLSQLAEGNPNKVIARKLDMCEATVKVHVRAILRKLGVRNRTQASLWAAAHGIDGVRQLS